MGFLQFMETLQLQLSCKIYQIYKLFYLKSCLAIKDKKLFYLKTYLTIQDN